MVRKKRAGLLIDYDIYYNTELCRGAYEACKEMDVQLVILFGGSLGYNQVSRNIKTDYQRTVIYQYANTIDVDFFIIPTTGICQSNFQLQKAFLNYFNKPTISLNVPVEGTSMIIFDNRTGIKEAVEYMIINGKRKNIGMISGFKGNYGSELRVQGYRDALIENNLGINEDNILYCPDYSRYNNELIGNYLDTHPDLDAIMCATDNIAFCLYTELDKRNIKIGKDILVAGFDDSVEGSSLVPALASVHADSALLSYFAVMNGLKQIETGERFNEKVPTNFIPRMSVGYNVHNEHDLYNFISHCKENGLGDHYIAAGITEYIFLNRLVFSSHIKELTEDLLYFILSTEDKDINDTKINSDLITRLTKLFTQENIHFIDLDKLLCSVSLLLDIESIYNSRDEQLSRKFYRYVFSQSVNCFNSLLAKQAVQNNQQLYIINSINKETMVIGGSEYCNHTLEASLIRIGVQNAQIFFYPNSRLYNNDYNFELNDTMILGVHIKNNKIVPCHNIVVNTKDVIESLGTDYMIMAPIYFNEYQYGIIVADTPYDKLSQLEYISTQFGTIINANELLNSLDEISITDELTKLYNRRGLTKKIAEINRTDKLYYLLIADLDKLKIINDNFGHEHGDNAIKRACEILKEVFPINSTIFRTGGDEFMVIFSDVDRKFVGQLDERIKTITQHVNNRYDYPYYVSMSYGVTVYDNSKPEELQHIIDNADQLMYERKRRTRKK